MPSPSDASPNAVALAVGVQNPLVTHVGGGPSAVFLGVGSRYQAAGGLASGNLRTTLCLGESALAAGKKRFTVTAHGSGLFGLPQDVFVDSAQLFHDENCPTPGTLLNGDFEKAPTLEWPTGGWTLESPTYDDEAALEASSALSGTRSGVLRRLDACSGSPSLSAPVSLPAQGGKRLQARVQGQGVGRLLLQLEGLTLDARPASALAAPGGVMSACVPPAFAGTVRTVRLELTGATSPLCGPELNEVRVDEVGLVDDPACPAGPGFPNGGAELGAAGWYPHADAEGNTAFFSVPVNAAVAHTGSRYVEVTVDDPCTTRALTQPFVVPARAASGGGMAVKYAYQLEAGVVLEATLPGHTELSATATAGWTDVVMCLSPGLDGFDAELRLAVAGTGGMCGSIPPAAARVDDLRVEPDPSCP